MLAALLRLMVCAEMAAALLLAWVLRQELGWPTAVALATGIAAPLLIHALIVVSDFFITSRVSGKLPEVARMPLTRVAGLVGREIVDSIRTFQFAQPFRARLPAPPSSPPDPARLPVLLVHGYLCNRGIWRPLAGWLMQRGHAVDAIDLEPLFADIDDYADAIDAAVGRLKARTRASRVALVCHSMGGLAARAYLRRHGAASIAEVVTIGTPHGGTVFAHAGRGLNARQMRPKGEWLQALEACQGAEERALFTVVMSYHDNIVAPFAAQRIQGARVHEIVGIGHISLAYDRSIWRIVAGALDEAAARCRAAQPGSA